MFFSVLIYILVVIYHLPPVIPDTAYTNIKWRTQRALCSPDQAQINLMQLGLENISHAWGKMSSIATLLAYWREEKLNTPLVLSVSICMFFLPVKFYITESLYHPFQELWECIKKSIQCYVLTSILFIEIILEDPSCKTHSSVTPYPHRIIQSLQNHRIIKVGKDL